MRKWCYFAVVIVATAFCVSYYKHYIDYRRFYCPRPRTVSIIVVILAVALSVRCYSNNIGRSPLRHCLQSPAVTTMLTIVDDSRLLIQNRRHRSRILEGVYSLIYYIYIMCFFFVHLYTLNGTAITYTSQKKVHTHILVSRTPDAHVCYTTSSSEACTDVLHIYMCLFHSFHSYI